MKIYTLTLNPAYDVHAHSQEFASFRENFADISSVEAGGKGLNISRALCSCDVANTALIVLGSYNSEEYLKQIRCAQINHVIVERPGRIRENITIHCDHAPETRISFSGFEAGDDALDELVKHMSISEDTYITMTGRIAPGMNLEWVKDFLKNAKLQGAKIVIDSRSFGMADILDVQPWLIKPNREEISSYCKKEVTNAVAALTIASELAAAGIENVMISLGEQGAVLASGNNRFIADAPDVQVISTIGAGDSAIAGFLFAAEQGKTPDSCLAYAVAFGSAACMQPGTQPPDFEMVAALMPKIHVVSM